MYHKIILGTSLVFLSHLTIHAQNKPLRDYGVKTGVLPTGTYNAITDVNGVEVGHITLIDGDSIRTGVTAILPYDGNIFQEKIPAGFYAGNGFGKLAGSTQIQELGNLETPIVLTNTLNVAAGINALIQHTLSLPNNENVRSVNAFVGETNDGYLNDIRGQHVTEQHVLQAIATASSGEVSQGNVGAGTGTRCFSFKGGIGTASRVVDIGRQYYTIGVLVQANFGGVLQIKGLPMGELLKDYQKDSDGSCMMVVATDAPMDSRNLNRLAKRAMLGLARTGGIASNGSGDYVIAFSTAESVRIPYLSNTDFVTQSVLRNAAVSPLFLGCIEATEEAIYNALFAAEDMTGYRGAVRALPEQEVLELLNQHGLDR